jgi:hypothetical protein
MKKFKVVIKGNENYPYYMQHRMDDIKLEEWEKKRGRIIERNDVAKEDLVRAEYHLYRNKKGVIYIPSEHIRCSLINAGKYVKAKVGNANKNMSNIVAGMFYISPEELPLKQDYDIDKRSAVNQNIKARIISIRPKFTDWETEFVLSVDNDTITNDTIRSIIEYAGSYVGIGSYRPEHKGQFGRFVIKEFKELKK